MNKEITIALTGACGRIGYQFCFQALSNKLFGENTKINFRLIDMPSFESKLMGIKLELNDCANDSLGYVTTHTDFNKGIQEADWIILIGSKPRTRGMERSDLLKQNADIFKEQGRSINRLAKSTAQVIIVGNPANTNASVIHQYAPQLESNQIFSLMTLDENRARSLLAEKAGISPKEIQSLIIFGNHSRTMFPDIYHAQLADGSLLTDLINDADWMINDFIPKVQGRGSEVIQLLGQSSAASAANSVCDLITYLSAPSSRIFSAGIISKGEYGSMPGTCFSMPCQMTKDGLKVITEWTHGAVAKKYIQRTIDELNAEYGQLKQHDTSH